MPGFTRTTAGVNGRLVANKDFGHMRTKAKPFPEDRASKADYVACVECVKAGRQPMKASLGTPLCRACRVKLEVTVDDEVPTPISQTQQELQSKPPKQAIRTKLANRATGMQMTIRSPNAIYPDAMSLPSGLRKNVEAALKQLRSNTSQEFESIWWEEGSCSFIVPRGTPKEQRQWQERLQAAAQQAFDSTPDSSNGSEASFEFNILCKTRVDLLQRFLEDLPLLTAQWGRVAADASWYDKMVADPVSCAWLGNILISDWLSCIAIRTDVMTDAVFRETCAIRRERVLRLVLAGSSGRAAAEKLPDLDGTTHSDTIKNSSTAPPPDCIRLTASAAGVPIGEVINATSTAATSSTPSPAQSGQGQEEPSSTNGWLATAAFAAGAALETTVDMGASFVSRICGKASAPERAQQEQGPSPAVQRLRGWISTGYYAAGFVVGMAQDPTAAAGAVCHGLSG